MNNRLGNKPVVLSRPFVEVLIHLGFGVFLELCACPVVSFALLLGSSLRHSAGAATPNETSTNDDLPAQSAGDHEGQSTGSRRCETGVRGQNGRTVHPHPSDHSGASRQ